MLGPILDTLRLLGSERGRDTKLRKDGCSIRATENPLMRTERGNMNVPGLTDVEKFDLAKASEFVEFWSQFYDYRVTVFGSKQEIDYFSELNTGNDLTAENVRRPLRWKDEMMLSERHFLGRIKGKATHVFAIHAHYRTRAVPCAAWMCFALR